MEREICFRGKTINGNEWIYGPTISRGTIKRKANKWYMEVAENKWKGLQPNTLGQYTGLKDKNGKEIYEGDIVLTPFVDPIFGDMVGEDLCVKRQVKFNDGSFVVNEGDGFIYLECFTRNNHIEIYGNIHDNPELLKDGRD